tara:strand:+ start:335 stop:1576 length:1242 start_codon:yes stop_codon:yes gene_type:complete
MIEKLSNSIEKCQICSEKNLEIVLSLGHQAMVQEYLNEQSKIHPKINYPLNLCRCKNCGLLQLNNIVDPQIVFPKSYPYKTGMTNMLIRNFRSLSSELIKDLDLSDSDLVVDIGSNDGTLLQGFQENNIKVLGIEPTDVADLAIENNIPTIKEYFNVDVASHIIKNYGKAKLILATNVFAHINNIFEFLDGVKSLLNDDGVFVTESQYIVDAVEKNAFDTIYHEHLRFYSVKPLLKLFDLVGFSLVNAERINAAGGSIRIYAKVGKEKVNDNVNYLIKKEEQMGLYKTSRLSAFAEECVKVKYELLNLLTGLKKQNFKIVGIGSPARSNTLLGFSKIDSHILDYICERKGSYKIGLYTPGTHIPVVDEERLFQDQPDYALILSWHIGEELIVKLKELGFKNKFILPLPKPKII